MDWVFFDTRLNCKVGVQFANTSSQWELRPSEGGKPLTKRLPETLFRINRKKYLNMFKK
jgi:hypothetical protein